MAKMSPEDKLAAVQRYVNGKKSSRTVAADFDLSHRYLLSLVKQYEHNGVETFVRRYTNYTKAFKLDVLNYKGTVRKIRIYNVKEFSILKTML